MSKSTPNPQPTCVGIPRSLRFSINTHVLSERRDEASLCFYHLGRTCPTQPARSKGINMHAERLSIN